MIVTLQKAHQAQLGHAEHRHEPQLFIPISLICFVTTPYRSAFGNAYQQQQFVTIISNYLRPAL